MGGKIRSYLEVDTTKKEQMSGEKTKIMYVKIPQSASVKEYVKIIS